MPDLGWTRHAADLADWHTRACLHAASEAGFSDDEADACEQGQLGCAGCPWQSKEATQTAEDKTRSPTTVTPVETSQKTWCAVPITREDINHALGLDRQSHVGMDMPSYLVAQIAEHVGSAFFERDGWQIIADIAVATAPEYLSEIARQYATQL